MSNYKTLSLSAAVFSAAVLSAVTAPLTAQAAPFGNPEDVAFADKVWSALVDARLVGPKAFHPMPYETAPPHGNIVESIDGMLTVDGRESIVIVKRNMGKRDETTVQQAAKDPDKFTTSVTVMYKMEAGYDPENKDWFWAKFKPDGTMDKNPKGMSLAGRVAKGADQGCIACHSAAEGGDMVFIHDRYAN